MQVQTTNLVARALIVATLFPTPALAGGIERNTITSLDQPEVWASVPSGGVPFSVVRYQDGNGQFYIPGFPYIGTAPTGISPQKEAGIYNVLDAAEEWNLFDPVDYPYANTTSFAYAPPTVGPVFSAASSLSPLSAPPPAGIGSPTGVPLPPIPPRVFYADGANMVNLWEPSASFNAFGGAFTLGLALVYIDFIGGTGTILEADIAMNTRSVNAAGVPIYSFIGDHVGDGNTYASNSVPGSDHTPPATAYASLKGVLMHEFGHTAGLGHSVIDVDSNPAGENEYPTMNFVALYERAFSTTITVPKAAPGPVFGFSNVDVTSSNTGIDAVFAFDIETLSLDDRSALIEAYPGPGLSALGGISGRVFQDPAVSGSATPLREAHVVVFDANDPNRRRVGRISFGSQATYTIRGLEPGVYHVMVEPLDIGGFLFPGAALPAIVSAAPPTNFFTELWGGPSGEATNEAGVHQAFSTVQVFPGITISGVDFFVQSRPAGTLDPMTVTTSSQLGPLGVGTPTGSPPPPAPFLVIGPSAHGIQYPFGALNAFNTTATFTVNGGAAAANTLGYVFGALTSGRVDVGPYSSSAGTSYLQLYMLNAANPTITLVGLDGNGQASVPYVVPMTFGLASVNVQAMYFDTNLNHYVLTNKVSVRSVFP